MTRVTPMGIRTSRTGQWVARVVPPPLEGGGSGGGGVRTEPPQHPPARPLPLTPSLKGRGRTLATRSPAAARPDAYGRSPGRMYLGSIIAPPIGILKPLRRSLRVRHL